MPRSPPSRAFVPRPRRRARGAARAPAATQTNEIGRCVAVPAGVRACSPPRSDRWPTSTSAPAPGSTCSTDRYHYDVRAGRRAWARRRSSVHVRDRGGGAGAAGVPRFAAAGRPRPRPIDVRDPDQARWLEACVWPDQPDRFDRLGRRSRWPGRSASTCAGGTPSPIRGADRRVGPARPPGAHHQLGDELPDP